MIEEQSLLLFPNPAKEELYLEFTAKTTAEALFWISNLQRQRLMTKAVNIVEGSQYLRYFIEDLAEGM